MLRERVDKMMKDVEKMNFVLENVIVQIHSETENVYKLKKKSIIVS
jgi:hypothetical protein